MRVQLQGKERRRKARNIRNTLAHATLIALSVAAGVAAITAPGLTEAVRGITGRRQSQQQVYQAVQGLYRRGYITLAGTRGERKALLTDAGRRAAYLHSLQRKKPDRKKWDQTWFMVSFDVPKERKKARDSLRDKLKQLGFVQYHKSLYIHPCDYKSELDFIADYYDVTNCVFYFYSADIARHDDLVRIFSLK